MQEQEIKQLVGQMRSGDMRALSRLMTLVENDAESIPVVMCEVYFARRHARRIGIAGPPGSGKSTLIANIIQHTNTLGLRTGVLCVDPTSPISGGAILGDRVRMSIPEIHPDTFIRSIASGGSLGGLAAVTRFHAILLEAFGADLILIETIGIGQVGYDIRDNAETLILVLVPESGDTIQVLKSGILELADIIIVNKSDREGATGMVETLKSTIETTRNLWRIPIVMTSALHDKGTAELWDAIESHKQWIAEKKSTSQDEDYLNDLRDALMIQLKAQLTPEFIMNHPLFKSSGEKVKKGILDPYSAARNILNDILNSAECRI
ncbi:MAG: methylmalonyl Co-A mutase-associated GTPase MeaB [bacterium]